MFTSAVFFASGICRRGSVNCSAAITTAGRKRDWWWGLCFGNAEIIYRWYPCLKVCCRYFFQPCWRSSKHFMKSLVPVDKEPIYLRISLQNKKLRRPHWDPEPVKVLDRWNGKIFWMRSSIPVLDSEQTEEDCSKQTHWRDDSCVLYSRLWPQTIGGGAQNWRGRSS